MEQFHNGHRPMTTPNIRTCQVTSNQAQARKRQCFWHGIASQSLFMKESCSAHTWHNDTYTHTYTQSDNTRHNHNTQHVTIHKGKHDSRQQTNIVITPVVLSHQKSYIEFKTVCLICWFRVFCNSFSQTFLQELCWDLVKHTHSTFQPLTVAET